jgi:hypothetical protein
LINAIRNDPRIYGIKLPNVKKEVKTIAFADDATHPISRPCLNEIMDTYRDFGKGSGSEVNVDKTAILLLGRFSERNIPAEYRRYMENISNILGIPWNKKGACGDTNWKKTIGKIDETIEKWED